MDIFEYLMVMVSIVLGLGLTQVLRGFGKIVRATQRYSVVTLWAVTLFFFHVQVWWGMWDLREVTDWNQLSFLAVIGLPCALFGATELLLPHSSPPGIDWQEHFFKVRRWFFAVFCVFALAATLETWVLLDVPLTHPYRIGQLAVLALGVVGFVTERARAHLWVAVATLSVFVLGQSLFRFLPAAL